MMMMLRSSSNNLRKQRVKMALGMRAAAAPVPVRCCANEALQAIELVVLEAPLAGSAFKLVRHANPCKCCKRCRRFLMPSFVASARATCPAPGAKWWMRVNQKGPLTSREETLRMGGILWETLSNTA